MKSEEMLMALPPLQKLDARAHMFERTRENLGKEIHALQTVLECEKYKKTIEAIAKVDPRLARLLEDADRQRQVGLQNVLDYVTHKIGN